MLRINRKVEYALMALKYMAQKGEGKLSSAREICERFKTPFDTTAKVMQILNSNGILTSVKGVKGGYYLAKDLGEITYLELCDMIEGSTYIPQCAGSTDTCELYESCNIVTPLHDLSRKIINVLKGVTLKELLQLDPDIDFKIEVVRSYKNKRDVERERAMRPEGSQVTPIRDEGLRGEHRGEPQTEMRQQPEEHRGEGREDLGREEPPLREGSV